MLFYMRFSDEHKDADVAQSVVRRIGSAEVTGPIPVSSFFICKKSPEECPGSFFYSGRRSSSARRKTLDFSRVFLILPNNVNSECKPSGMGGFLHFHHNLPYFIMSHLPISVIIKI